MTDQGRSALAKRGTGYWFGNPERAAAAILGEHGLFIANASEHEPVIRITEPGLWCRCGWSPPIERYESYFDHIGAAP